MLKCLTCALISGLTAIGEHLGCLWLLLNHKVVLKKSWEGAEYPLNNMGLGCAEHFAGLDLLVFSFGERRSKSWHEAGAVVLLERSLKWAGGDIFPGTPTLAMLSAGGDSGRTWWGRHWAWRELLKAKWKACVAQTCQVTRSWLIKHCICLHEPTGGMMAL